MELPTLVGIQEIANILGVSKQRASYLSKQTSFPKPVCVLAMGPIWTERSVYRFMINWNRKVGRPNKKEKE